MSIVVTCPCGKSYPIKEQFAGHRVQCPGCKRVLIVPGGASSVPVPFQPSAAPVAHPYVGSEHPRASSRSPFVILVILFILILAGSGTTVFFFLQGEQSNPVAANDPETTTPIDDKPRPVVSTPPETPKKRVEPPAPVEPKKLPVEPPSPPPVVPMTPVVSGSTWEGHHARILGVGFPRDGSLAFTATGGLVKRDGQLAPASDTAVRLWDWSAGTEQKRIEGFRRGLSIVAFDPAGNLFVVTDAANARDELENRDGAFDLHVWEVAGKREVRVLRGHDKIVLCAAFTPDGRKLLSGGRDARLRLWDVDAGSQIGNVIEHPGFIYAVAVSHDGKNALTACGDRAVRLFDLGEKRLLKTMPRHQDLVWCVAFSPDGKYAVSGGGDDYDASTGNYVIGSKDYEIRLWDLATGQEVRRFSGHTSTVTAVAFSKDGRRLLSSSWDKTVRLWHVPSGRELGKFTEHTDMVQTVAFFPDGRHSLSGGYDKAVRVWTLPPDVGDLAKRLLEPDVDRLAVLREIARYGTEAKESIPALLKLINDPDKTVKHAALETLGKVGSIDKNQVELLIPLLKDASFPEGRQLALNALAGLGRAARPALPELLGLLKDKTSATRVKSLSIIAAIGEDARKTGLMLLLELLRDDDPAVAKAASEALPKLGKPTKTDLATLTKYLTDPAEAVRRYSLLAIAELGEEASAATAGIITALDKDASAEMRLLALDALVKVQSDHAVLLGPLTRALADRDAKVQEDAAAKLTDLPTTTAVLPALLKALAHDNEKVQEIADQALAKFPFLKEHVKLLSEGLRSKRAKVRLRMLKAVAKLKSEGLEAVPALIEELKSATGDERLQAVYTVGTIGPEARAAGPALAGLLKGSDRPTQLSICLVLTKINAKEAKETLPFLVGLLLIEKDTDEAKNDRKTAAEMLIQIGEPAIDALIKALSVDFTGAGKIRAEARVATMEVIVAIGKNTKEPLRKALLPLSAIEGSDIYPEVRAIAKAARIELQKEK